MADPFVILIAVVVMAVLFDFVNGFHDAANAIATSVSTGVMPLRVAVLAAGGMNFLGALFGTAVAATFAKGFADPAIVMQETVLAALVGAIAWNLITWWWGIPSSSSHALVGGLSGAVCAQAGFGAFNWATLGKKVLIPIVASPVLGFVMAFLLMMLLGWLFKAVSSATANSAAKKLQLASALTMAYSHGSNDAQKSMGIITLSLLAYVANPGRALPEWVLPQTEGAVPQWVVLACAGAIALGTVAGGKRIIKTMGRSMTPLRPMQGFAAESAASGVILLASALGIPVSTTHAITATIMGAGAGKRMTSVRWGVTRKVVTAWIVTIPASFAVSWVTTKVIWLLLS